MMTFLSIFLPLVGVGIVGHGLIQLRRERDACEFRRLFNERKEQRPEEVLHVWSTSA